jgi:hypothetical protein
MDWMIGIIDSIYTLLETTGNYTLYRVHYSTLVSSVCYTPHHPFPGNGFCHKNYNSVTESHIPNITVTTAHVKSTLRCRTISSETISLGSSIICQLPTANHQLRNSRSSSLLQLSTILLPSLFNHLRLPSEDIRVKVTLRLTASQSVSQSWCRAHMLLALASADLLGSESLGTRDHILLSQI